MKNLILLSLTTLMLLSCSHDSNTDFNANILQEEKLGNTDVANRMMGICPLGYHAVWTFEVTVTLFKPFSTCSNGFGFCFVRTTVNLDCKRNVVPTVSYDSAAKSMSVMIEALDDEKARVWIDSEAVSSPDHVLSDFDYMDIGDLELTNGVSLKAGVYAKNISGTYFYYDVPFN